MTIEELKKEANKLGYNIIKKQEYIRIMPCVCGRKRINHWYGYSGIDGDYIFLECPVCGIRSEKGKNENQAKINWNKKQKELRR